MADQDLNQPSTSPQGPEGQIPNSGTDARNDPPDPPSQTPNNDGSLLDRHSPQQPGHMANNSDGEVRRTKGDIIHVNDNTQQISVMHRSDNALVSNQAQVDAQNDHVEDSDGDDQLYMDTTDEAILLEDSGTTLELENISGTDTNRDQTSCDTGERAREEVLSDCVSTPTVTTHQTGINGAQADSQNRSKQPLKDAEIEEQPVNLTETEGHDVLMIDIENNPEQNEEEVIEKDLGCIDISSDIDECTLETNFSEDEAVEVTQKIGTGDPEEDTDVAIEDTSGGPERMEVTEEGQPEVTNNATENEACLVTHNERPTNEAENTNSKPTESRGETLEISSKEPDQDDQQKGNKLSVTTDRPSSPQQDGHVNGWSEGHIIIAPTLDQSDNSHNKEQTTVSTPATPVTTSSNIQSHIQQTEAVACIEDVVQITQHRVNKRKRTEPRQKGTATSSKQGAGLTQTDDNKNATETEIKLEKPDTGYEAALHPASSAPAAPVLIAPQPATPAFQYRFRQVSPSTSQPSVRKNAPSFSSPTIVRGQPQTIMMGPSGVPQVLQLGTVASQTTPRSRLVIRQVSPGAASSPQVVTMATGSSPSQIRGTNRSSQSGPVKLQPKASTNYQIRTVQVGSGGTEAPGTRPVTILIPQSVESLAPQSQPSSVSTTGTQQFIMSVGGKALVPSPAPHTSQPTTTTTQALVTSHAELAKLLAPASKSMSCLSTLSMPSGSANINCVVDSKQSWILPGKSVLQRKYSAPAIPGKLHLTNRQVKTCKACGDIFHTDEGLETHMKRRSLDLNFQCSMCMQNVMGYNKCSLLAGLSVHNCLLNTPHSAVIDLSKVICKPISVDALSDSARSELERVKKFRLGKTGKDNKENKGNPKSKTSVASDKGVVDLTENAKERSTKASNKADPKQTEQHAAAMARLAQLRKGFAKCPECQSHFETRGGLAQHFVPKRKHKDRSYKCDKCLMLLPTGCSFKAHIRVHNVAAPYVCPECGEATFSSRQLFMKHVKKMCLHFNRLPNWPCPVCDQSFPVQNHLEDHISSKHAHVYYKCTVCPMAFRCQESFDRHNAQVHTGKAKARSICKCPMCDTVFQSVKQLGGAHLLKHLTAMDSNTNGLFKYKCLSCAQEFGFKYALTQHVMKEHPSMIVKGEMCNYCGEEFTRNSQLLSHTVASHPEQVANLEGELSGDLICEYCGKHFAKSSNFYQHVSLMHPQKMKNKDNNQDLVCEYCGQCFMKSSCFFQHMSRKHPHKLSECKAFNPDGKSDRQKAMKCDHCHKNFGDIKKLFQHVALAHPEILHNDAQEEQEQGAEKEGTKEEDKEEDKEEQEGKEEEEEETESVADTSHDEAEVKESSGRDHQPWQYDCGQCQMVFEDSAIYMRHMAKHRFIKKKKKKTAGSDNEEKAKDKGGLQRILSQYKLNKEPVPRVVTHPTRSPSPEPQLSCPECDLAFFEDEELQEHLQEVHNIKPTFSCHLCGITYNDSGDLTTHVRRVHEGKLKADMYLCCLCKEKDIWKSYSSRGPMLAHLRGHKVHKAQTEETLSRCINVKIEKEEESYEKGSGETREPAPKKLRLEGDETFTCAKCEYKTECREDFSHHIIKHQREKTACQCLECGLCFAVQPALKRHLFMVHKVRDFNKYMNQSGQDLDFLPQDQEANIDVDVSKVVLKNGIFRPKRSKGEPVKNRPVSRGKSESESSPEPGQCPVCHKRFDKEQELKKHIRNHGMAYIRSRRRASCEDNDPS